VAHWTSLLRHVSNQVPQWATARLQAADASQVEQWADRVLDAPSIEAVFIGH
jgi:hypothetical protein